MATVVPQNVIAIYLGTIFIETPNCGIVQQWQLSCHKKIILKSATWKNRGICYDHTRFGYDFIVVTENELSKLHYDNSCPAEIILKSATWKTALRNRNDCIILIYISYTPGGQPKVFLEAKESVP